MDCVKCDMCGVVSGEVRIDREWTLVGNCYSLKYVRGAKLPYSEDEFTEFDNMHLCPECTRAIKTYIRRWAND